MNTLLRNVNVINLGLSALVLYFAYFLLFPLMDLPVVYSLPPVKPSATEKTETEAPSPPTLNPMEYTLIADQNLFHPERKIPPEKKAEAPLPKPEFVLYGTLVTSDMGIAYLEDKKGAPVTTQGRGKRQTALKKGESLSGYILKDLFNDRVVMNRGEETVTVYLNDPQAPKVREGVPDLTKTAPKAAMGAPPALSRPGTAPAGQAGTETRPRTTAPQTAPTAAGTTPPSAISGLPSSGTPAASPGIPGAFTPSRPRYRPVPSGPYPAPSPSRSPVRPYP